MYYDWLASDYVSQDDFGLLEDELIRQLNETKGAADAKKGLADTIGQQQQQECQQGR